MAGDPASASPAALRPRTARARPSPDRAALPLFPVTVVGSWPRPPALLDAQRRKRQGRLAPDAFDRIADEAVLEALRAQDGAGVDVVSDGELRRDNFFSFVAEKLDGVELLTLAEMLDIVEDKAAFERILLTLDAPAYAISNAVCAGRITARRPLVVDDLRFLRQHTAKPVKVTLPGPYLLTRAMYVPAVSRAAYPTKEDLGRDVVAILRAEVEALAREGAAFIQRDEPVLTELVFTSGQTRTFMCAALAERGDPTAELELATHLLDGVLGGADVGGARVGLHVCRGNWSRDESILLRGGYRPLAAHLERLTGVRQLVLEYATDRAGDLVRFAGKELGLGVVNPRSARAESAEEIVRRVERALALYPAEDLWLNPDCGFGTFSNRPVNDAEVATRKLAAIATAASILRGTIAPTGP
jgi:5-methyltetrahydropteroyltriglutamate--homocysteine methyltransferase